MGFNGWFRRNQKKVYILMIFAMGVWGIGSSVMFMIPQKPMGTVFGEKVRKDEFIDFEERWRKIVLSGVRKPSLDIIWKQLVYERAAKQSGIIVTDRDVMEGVYDIGKQLLQAPSTIPSEQLVMIMCNAFHVNRSQLLQTIREVVTIHKLDFFLKSSVKVTKDEAWQRYSSENEKVKLKYVEFKAEDFVDSVNVTEQEVSEFYNKYKDLIPDKLKGSYGYKEEEKVKIEYIMADYSEMQKRVAVDENEMLKYYEDKKDEFILPVKIAENSDADSKEDAEPEKKYKPFDEVKGDIKNQLLKDKAKEFASDLISKVDEVIYENIDKLNKPSFEDLAKKYGLTYEIPKHGKNNSEFVTKAESETLLVGTDRLSSIAFNRDKFDPSPPMSSLQGMYIFQVLDKRAPMSSSLADARQDVERDLKTEKAFRKARELAEQCLKKMEENTFDSGYKSFVGSTGIGSISVEETEFLNRGLAQNGRTPEGYIVAMQGYRPNVSEKAFSIKDKEVALAVEDEGKKACYVVSLADKKEVDAEEFEGKLEEIIRGYTNQKQRYLLKKWEENITNKSELYIEL